MSAFFSLSDDEDAGPSSSSLRASSSAMAIDAIPATPSASPFSRRSKRRQSIDSPTPPRASRSAAAGHRQTSPSLSAIQSSVTSGPPVQQPAIERLQRVWVSERCSPELMPWSDPNSRWKCDDIVDDVCMQIEQQVSILNLLTADENTSEEEHLRLSLVQLDVERTKWLLRAFLRTRIHKLEANAQHYLSLPQSQQAKILSPLETAYAKKYTSLRSNHLKSSVLDYLPEELRGLADEDVSEGRGGYGGMVTRPDLNEPVFVQCVEDCGGLTMADGETATLSKGSIHILSYARVSHLVRQGRAILI